MDEMTALPGEGNGQANGDARAITRDPVGWRAAVFGTPTPGYTAQEAVSLIDETYNGSITKKLTLLKAHEREGGHYKLCPRGRGVGRPQ